MFPQAALLLLKYVKRPDLARLLGTILETLRPCAFEQSDEARLHATLVYVASPAPQLGPQQLAGILESMFPKQGQALEELRRLADELQGRVRNKLAGQ